MKNINEVVTLTIFEAQNGIINSHEAKRTIEDYISESFIQLDRVKLPTLAQMPIKDVIAFADALGVCFPVHDGIPTIKLN